MSIIPVGHGDCDLTENAKTKTTINIYIIHHNISKAEAVDACFVR